MAAGDVFRDGARGAGRLMPILLPGFALVVAVGIFFIRTKKTASDEPLGKLIEEPESVVHSDRPSPPPHRC